MSCITRFRVVSAEKELLAPQASGKGPWSLFELRPRYASCCAAPQIGGSVLHHMPSALACIEGTCDGNNVSAHDTPIARILWFI